MKKIYYLDLPVIPKDKDGATWIPFKIYKSRKEAVKVLNEIWGIKSQYANAFITEGENYD